MKKQVINSVFCLAILFFVGCSSSPAGGDFEIKINSSNEIPAKRCQIQSGNEISLTVDTGATSGIDDYQWEDSLGDDEGGIFKRETSHTTNYVAPMVVENKDVTISVTVFLENGSEMRVDTTCYIVGQVAQIEPSETPTPTVAPVPTETAKPNATEVVPVVEEKPAESAALSPPLATTDQAIELFQERGYIIVGVREDAAPFGVFDNGNYVGFDIDIAREMAKRWLGDENSIEYVKVIASENPDDDFLGRIESVVKEEVDFTIGAITFTPDRCTTAICSLTYYQDGARLLVRADSGITGPGDLDNRLVSVVEGTTAEKNIIELQQSYPYTNPPRLIYKPDRIAAISAVRSGEADAYSTDGKILEAFADSELVVVGGEFTDEPYTVVINKNDAGLRNLINTTFREMKEDGWYRSIYEKHFGCETPYLILQGDEDVRPSYVKNQTPPEGSICADQAVEQTGTWMVTSGQTLGGIAKDHYGDFNLYACIQEASGLDNPNLLVAGMELTLPPLAECLDS